METKTHATNVSNVLKDGGIGKQSIVSGDVKAGKEDRKFWIFTENIRKGNRKLKKLPTDRKLFREQLHAEPQE